VRQRARLLDRVMADLHGPQTLLSQGLLPASLVLDHPQYLRPMHGAVPAGGVHLHVAAFDLTRGADGRWALLGQRLQAPSGLGYLLENRLIIGQQFPEAFRALRVQRIASAFQGWLQGLMRLSPAGERSRIVLLTPGPYSETYFEQVFLARYLGLTLVEGGDLTVRHEQVFLKTLHGLERVHIILRRVDDDFVDPLELRADSALGVPGLLQAVRAGEVVLANAPGAGVLESPGLAAFWPAVARHLGEGELSLPAVTSWWCGEPAVWAAQRERLAEFVAVPTFPAGGPRGGAPVVMASLDAAGRAAWAARIDADPAAWTLQARVRPGETPVWLQGRLEPRPAVVRVYALTDGQGGWSVLPGGMTRVASRRVTEGDAWLSMQHGSQSIDTWVRAAGEVDALTLLPPPLSPEDLEQRHRSVTSRSAENLFWLGRYTERAENSLRLARLTLEALPQAGPASLSWLGELCRRHGLVPSNVPLPVAGPQAARVFERALLGGLGADSGLCSVGFNLRALRGCAQALRERLSPEHWRHIHEVGDHFEQHLAQAVAAASARGGEPGASVGDVLGVMARAATHLAALTGAQTDRMTRDDGWRLLSVGRQIERLDLLAHALARGVDAGLHDSDDGFALLLGLFDSTITYRAQFQARRELAPLLHLVVQDTDNPRALAWVARTMRERVRKLARHDPDWATLITAPLPRPEDWSLAALCGAGADGRHAALIEGLEACSREALALSEALGRRLFSHARSVDRSVWQ
jgi:uncharacterized circularly permuted ATP-grasp superfamily protein/uncharacterized alpha-E superfamily protein